MKTKDSVFPEVAMAIGCVSLLVWAATRVVAHVHFEQDIGGHLKRAADANSLALASSELAEALYSMDVRRLCTEPGYTSVMWRTPDEDVGFWCENIASTLDDVTAADLDGVDHMTESNMLIKVRETLLDHGQSGDSVTAPAGISVYPDNGGFAWWSVMSAIMIAAGVAAVARRS